MSTPDLLRLAAAGAALVLGVTSSGDALVLAAALALAAWRPVAAVAVAGALTASAWRWGSSSLEAIAGAQAVLGPAGWVDPTSAAVGSVLAGIALVAAAPSMAGRLARLVAATASGAAAAVVVAGPAPGGDLWARVLVGAVAAGLAYAVGARRTSGAPAALAADGVAVLCGAAALVCVAQEAGGWSGTLSAASAGEGVAIALAAAGVVIAGRLGWAAMEQRRT